MLSTPSTTDLQEMLERQLHYLADALDLANRECDATDDAARRVAPGMRGELDDISTELRRLIRRVERLQAGM